MSASLDPAAARWLRRFPLPGIAAPAGPPVARLVCFPHAGGAASFYAPLARALAPSAIDVLAVQYPGRQDRRAEAPLATVAALADGAISALRGVLDVPVALFGHSMGATLGFEVAARLEARGTVVRALFASGRRAPSRYVPEDLHAQPDAALIAEVKSLDGTGAELLDDPDILDLILPALRGDYRAIETYRYAPRPPLGAPIVALSGDADPKVSRDELAAWSEHTAAGFASHLFPGGHFFLVEHLPAIAALIRGVIAPGPAATAP